jgi:hypothetical protein
VLVVLAAALLAPACGGHPRSLRSDAVPGHPSAADREALSACTVFPMVPWILGPASQPTPRGLTTQQLPAYTAERLNRAWVTAATAAGADPRWQPLADLTRELQVDIGFLERGSPVPADIASLGYRFAVQCQLVAQIVGTAT